jgi:hypothetical protein
MSPFTRLPCSSPPGSVAPELRKDHHGVDIQGATGLVRLRMIVL